MKRNVYLNTVDLAKISETLEYLYRCSDFKNAAEEVSVFESLHRVTKEAIYAKVSSPCYSAAAMDGIQVRAIETFEATESSPVVLSKEMYQPINTGDVIDERFDAVVMIEDVIEDPDQNITLIKSVSSYKHIRPIGEDIVQGEMLLPKNHKIRPIDISALLSGGIKTIFVIKKPDIAIIPTGDEIISDVDDLASGKIIDSNSYYLKNEIDLIGGNVKVYSITKDDLEILETMILEAVQNHDIVVVEAGSSAGTKDHTKSVIAKNGEVFVHGISIKPGKPTIIGSIDHTPVIGMPGYPVSTFIAYEEVLKPLILTYLNQDKLILEQVKAKLSKKVYSSLKHHEFVRVRLGVMNDQYIATPLDRGAGVTMSVVKADGIIEVPRNYEGYEANELVAVSLLKDKNHIKNSLVSIGSHDVLLDIVDDLMSNYKNHLSSSHTGSFGGIMAIKAGECHVAPVHILDGTGEYNKFIIDKYLDNSFALIRGVSRIQGLYVKKDNPKNISSIRDLIREDVTFINRQRGSGTRILLDHLLKNEHIDKNMIKGYDFELSTHMLVASSVKDPRFDTGMGIKSVANINDLDFIEIGEEQYDFLVRKDIMDTSEYKKFIEVLQSLDLKNELDKIGGYLIDNIGIIVK